MKSFADLFQSDLEHLKILNKNSLILSDYKDLGSLTGFNILKNLHFLPLSLSLKRLSGRFPSCPAIICGSGPSIEQEIDLLNEIKDKALIFAGGSAMGVLKNAQIAFDFGSVIDPLSSWATDNHLLPENVPIFYQTRVNHDLLSDLNRLKNPLIWCPDNGSYGFEEELCSTNGHSYNPFECGWNVINFTTKIAHFMGCSPLIFLGFDLCGQKGKVYASPLESCVEKIDKKDWLMAAHWQSHFVRNNPNVYINSSRGGRKIEFIPFREFSDVCQELLIGKNVCKDSLVDLSALESYDTKSIHDFEKKWVDSLSFCRANCESLLKLAEKKFPLKLNEHSEGVLGIWELEQELAYKTFLSHVWLAWKDEVGDDLLAKILFLLKIIDAFSHAKICYH